MTLRHYVFTLLLSSILAVPATTVGAAPSANVTAIDVDMVLMQPHLAASSRMRLELYQLINEVRADAGLPAYRLDARLTASAGEHAADMARNRFCRHTGSDGSSSRSRMARHGYPYNNWAGENIICSRWTPRSAMKWWMGSGPHRRNILHGHHTHIGIGYDPNGRYGPVWTLNFAAGAPDTVTPSFAIMPEFVALRLPQAN